MAFVEWDKHRINILDTPGDANFAMDTKSCLRVVDGAVVVVDAVGAVEFQTEKVWETAEEYALPRLVFINRMDRERANFENALNSVKEKLGKKATPLFIPIGAEDKFKGIIDLLQMKALFFDDPKGKPKAGEIPAELADQANKYREAMTEDIAECDEALMDKYLESGELTAEELKTGLRKGVVTGSLFPAVCGVANRSIGIAPLMDLVAAAMPSPLDRGDASGKNPSTGADEKRSPDEKAPFSAFVFKTISDPFAGRLTLFRVYSGTASSDGNFYNPTRKTTERFGNIFYLDGKSQRPGDGVIPGDIAAVAKLKETYTGDTMTEEKNPIQYEKVPPIPAIISFAVQPKSKGDEEKIMSGLNRLVEEDPTLNYRRDEQTREIILSGMGQVHIEIAVEKMKRKFGVEVTLTTPKVPYKETLKGKTTVQGRYKKQSGGRGQFGDTWLEIEPLPRGGGFEFADKIVGGAIPRNYIPAVEKGIVEAMLEGVLAGYPVVDVKVSLFDGSFHTVDSSEMAFKIAGSMGFKKGVEQCNPTLLEPIVNIDIEIPDEYMGDVIGDLNSRRGRVIGMEPKGHNQIIKGQVPLAEILRYAPDLRSITSGRGTFTYSHSHYEEVPPMIAEKVIAAARREKEEKG
jgi:elongation factor G